MKQAAQRIATWLPAMIAVITWPVFAQDASTLMRLESDLKKLLERVKPSVVTVTAPVHLGLSEDGMLSPRGENADEDAAFPIEINNIGSGIIYDSCHVITHTSVIWDSKNIMLTLANGREVPASLVGMDEDFGIAVLQTKEKLGPPAALRSGDALSSGSYVTIVGNALGVSAAVSQGIVNAIRSDGMIQLSANIVAGNAGGPVFDTSGRLVGLLAGFISPGETASMANYYGEPALAYPIREIEERVNGILRDENTPQGYVGVTAEDWPGVSGWIHISDVRPGSPAQQAGLRMGDIILNIDGQKLRNSRELAQRIRRHQPGGTISLGVLRGDSTHAVSIKIGDAQAAPGKRLPLNGPSTSIKVFQQFSIPEAPAPAAEQQQELLQRINRMEKELYRLRAMVKNR